MVLNQHDTPPKNAVSGKPPMRATIISLLSVCLSTSIGLSAEISTQNKQDTGYRGIWYMNQKSNDEYVYKYSGGLGNSSADSTDYS
jgi:hypothetical protein